MSILSLGVLLIISHSVSPVFGGGCIDNDGDGFFIRCGYTVDDCDDYNPDVYPGKGCALPVDEINNLINEINELADNGGIPGNQENALVSKLEKAIDKLEANNEKGAIGSLEAFINQVNALFKAKKITAEVRDDLIIPVQVLINFLKST